MDGCVDVDKKKEKKGGGERFTWTLYKAISSQCGDCMCALERACISKHLAFNIQQPATQQLSKPIQTVNLSITKVYDTQRSEEEEEEYTHKSDNDKHRARERNACNCFSTLTQHNTTQHNETKSVKERKKKRRKKDISKIQ